MVVRGKSERPFSAPPPLYSEFRVGFESREEEVESRCHSSTLSDHVGVTGAILSRERRAPATRRASHSWWAHDPGIRQNFFGQKLRSAVRSQVGVTSASYPAVDPGYKKNELHPRSWTCKI